MECGLEIARPGEDPPGAVLYDKVDDILQAPQFDGLHLRKVACLGNCDRECRLAIADPDRWSWMLGDVNPQEDAAFLRAFFQLWLDAPKGLIAKANRPDALKTKALGRMPPVLDGNRSGI